MKVRSERSAGELEGLYAWIDRLLDHVGLETQPEVATRILELSANPDAGLRDFAEVVRSDPTLAGRLIKMVNSAYFAQRKPVSDIERACVLLGRNRLKAISLGFYLSRAAAKNPDDGLSRRIWGQSVFRACLASQLVSKVQPQLASEAFIIGLMMDSGIPLLPELLGIEAAALLRKSLPPQEQFEAEFVQLAFTHVDVIRTMAVRWRFPEVLVKPLEWHHTPPGEGSRENPTHVLHRIAFYAGSVHFGDDGMPHEAAQLRLGVDQVLDLAPVDAQNLIGEATKEYEVMVKLFSGVADPIGDISKLADTAHQQLIAAFDAVLEDGFIDETKEIPQQFVISGQTLEVVVDEDGQAVAYVHDSSGQRLAAYKFSPAEVDAADILRQLGIEPEPNDQFDIFVQYLSKLAA